MNKENILVVSASYNEAENIKQFVNDLTKQNYHILIVDDNSPDGTGDFILNSEHYQRNLFLLSRENKQGYGTAYIEGFKWGLEKDYEYIVSMDTDLSHRVTDLDKMVDEIGNFDLNYLIVYVVLLRTYHNVPDLNLQLVHQALSFLVVF